MCHTAHRTDSRKQNDEDIKYSKPSFFVLGCFGRPPFKMSGLQGDSRNLYRNHTWLLFRNSLNTTATSRQPSTWPCRGSSSRTPCIAGATKLKQIRPQWGLGLPVSPAYGSSRTEAHGGSVHAKNLFFKVSMGQIQNRPRHETSRRSRGLDGGNLD